MMCSSASSISGQLPIFIGTLQRATEAVDLFRIVRGQPARHSRAIVFVVFAVRVHFVQRDQLSLNRIFLAVYCSTSSTSCRSRLSRTIAFACSHMVWLEPVRY